MIVESIVTQARSRLGDTNSTGWEDSELIDFVNQGQIDLCKTANVYKRTLHLGILNNESFYSLPPECFQVSRIEYDGSPLPVLSREDNDLDRNTNGLYVIKSDISMNLLELSLPFTDKTNRPQYVVGSSVTDLHTALASPLGVIASTEIDDGTEHTIITSPLGVVTNLTFSSTATDIKEVAFYGDISGTYTEGMPQYLSQPLGVTSEVNLLNYSSGGLFGFLTKVDNVNANGLYGICTDALPQDGYLKVYYSSMPLSVDSLYDALVVSHLWEKALVHYTVGMARQNDNDESNYALGEQEMIKYRYEIKVAKKLSARAYTSTVDSIKETRYRRI